MTSFISFPGTIVPFSAKTPEEGIEWAKDYADTLQLAYQDETFVSVIYTNMKTNEFGQVLSTRYAELVKQAFIRPTLQRVFINTLSVVGAENGGDVAIDYDQLAEAVSARIVAELPENGVTLEEIQGVVSTQLEPIKDDLQLAVDHARAANMQTKPEFG